MGMNASRLLEYSTWINEKKTLKSKLYQYEHIKIYLKTSKRFQRISHQEILHNSLPYSALKKYRQGYCNIRDLQEKTMFILNTLLSGLYKHPLRSGRSPPPPPKKPFARDVEKTGKTLQVQNLPTLLCRLHEISDTLFFSLFNLTMSLWRQVFRLHSYKLIKSIDCLNCRYNLISATHLIALRGWSHAQLLTNVVIISK